MPQMILGNVLKRSSPLLILGSPIIGGNLNLPYATVNNSYPMAWKFGMYAVPIIPASLSRFFMVPMVEGLMPVLSPSERAEDIGSSTRAYNTCLSLGVKRIFMSFLRSYVKYLNYSGKNDRELK